MRQISLKFLSAAMSLAVLLGGASEADASTGTVSGTLWFYNKNGSFCPTNASCTGATYKQSSYNTYIALPEVTVQIIRAANGAVIGTGSTNSAGNYQITWNSAADPGNLSAKLRVVWKHKTGRFEFHTLGNTPHLPVPGFDITLPLTAGTTVGAPQIKNWNIGSAAMPEKMSNLHWAAWRMFGKMLESTRMLQNLVNVDILAFEAPSNGPVTTSVTCAKSSCAYIARFSDAPERPAWAEKRLTLVLDGFGSTPYTPMKIMHELGHLADFSAGPGTASFHGVRRETGYDYLGSSSWSMTSTEYAPTALTEGFASFLAMSAFYDGSGTVAYHCMGNGVVANQEHCYPPDSAWGSMAIAMEAKATCSSPKGRHPYNVMRYFWDIYDTHVDGTDASDLTLTNILESLAYWPCSPFPGCYGPNQLHDQFHNISNSLLTTTVNPNALDENGAWDYMNNMLNNYPPAYNVSGAYTQNCMGNL
jgi:hypothetical protein